MPKHRERKNKPEALFDELYTKKGWRVTKRGWPDFFCFIPRGKFAAVEIKPRNAQGVLEKLKDSQVEILKVLSAHGIPCYVSDGETLEPFDERIHGGSHERREYVATEKRCRQQEPEWFED